MRPPVPANKHSAAMFLKLRGWLACDATHPQSAQRPDSDREILADIVKRCLVEAGMEGERFKQVEILKKQIAAKTSSGAMDLGIITAN